MDEVKPSDRSAWAYVCVLSVPCHRLKKALADLEEDRAVCGQVHELHFAGIKKKGAKSALAARWLSRVMDDAETWRFSVLGIDTDLICKDWFGSTPGERIYGPYKRFFRATLHHHLLSAHARNGPIEVWRVFHDSEGCLEADRWFSWHGIRLIEDRVPGIAFMDDEIRFVPSDHLIAGEHAKHSHFIQMCDLLVGTVRHCHEAVSLDRGKDLVGRHFSEFVERINCPDRCRNANGRFRHSNRAFLSYFPDRSMSMEDLANPDVLVRSGFYRGRRLRLLEGRDAQRSLAL